MLIDPWTCPRSYDISIAGVILFSVQFELCHPLMNTVHAGSPRGEPLRLCLIALRMVSVSEHTNLVQLKYKETVMQINNTNWSLYRNNTKVSMQLTESS